MKNVALRGWRDWTQMRGVPTWSLRAKSPRVVSRLVLAAAVLAFTASCLPDVKPTRDGETETGGAGRTGQLGGAGSSHSSSANPYGGRSNWGTNGIGGVDSNLGTVVNGTSGAGLVSVNASVSSGGSVNADAESSGYGGATGPDNAISASTGGVASNGGTTSILVSVGTAGTGLGISGSSSTGGSSSTSGSSSWTAGTSNCGVSAAKLR